MNKFETGSDFTCFFSNRESHNGNINQNIPIGIHCKIVFRKHSVKYGYDECVTLESYERIQNKKKIRHTIKHSLYPKRSCTKTNHI